jgi:hypothetical protein
LGIKTKNKENGTLKESIQLLERGAGILKLTFPPNSIKT